MRLWQLLTKLRLRTGRAERRQMLLRRYLHLHQLHLPPELWVSNRLGPWYSTHMDETVKQSDIAAALRAHEAELKRFVTARASFADVDDILQVSAIRALEKAESLQDASRLVPWLYRIHRNTAIDFARKRKSEERQIEALAAEPTAAAVPQEQDDLACKCSIEQARQLNSRYAAILDLVDVGGTSLSDAARRLGLTVNATTVRLHRARKALKERMLAHCGVNTMRECADCKCTSEGCCPT